MPSVVFSIKAGTGEPTASGAVAAALGANRNAPAQAVRLRAQAMTAQINLRNESAIK